MFSKTGGGSIVGDGTVSGRAARVAALGDSTAILDLDGAVVIGRHPSAHIRVLDSAVSLRHAEIRPVAEGYRICDLGSLNGTYVNGTPVAEADLRPGDEIRVGRVRMLFLATLPEAPAAPAMSSRGAA